MGLNRLSGNTRNRSAFGTILAIENPRSASGVVRLVAEPRNRPENGHGALARDADAVRQ